MRCHACWKEAAKIAGPGHRRPQTIYRHIKQLGECGHHDRTAKPKTRNPETNYTFTIGPLTPLHDLFPEGATR